MGFAPERTRASIYKTKPISTEKSGVAKFGGECLGGSEGRVRPIRAYDALPRASFAERDPIEGAPHQQGGIPMPSFRMRSLGALPIRTQ